MEPVLVGTSTWPMVVRGMAKSGAAAIQPGRILESTWQSIRHFGTGAVNPVRGPTPVAGTDGLVETVPETGGWRDRFGRMRMTGCGLRPVSEVML